jgi:hypothetical protein
VTAPEQRISLVVDTTASIRLRLTSNVMSLYVLVIISPVNMF